MPRASLGFAWGVELIGPPKVPVRVLSGYGLESFVPSAKEKVWISWTSR